MNMAERTFVILKHVNKVPSLACRAGKLFAENLLMRSYRDFGMGEA